MSDVDTAQAAEPRYMEVLITKAKKMIAVNTTAISEQMFEEIIYRGLADILNSGMSKITVKDLEGEELAKAQDAALAKAEDNYKTILADKVKHKGARGGASKSKVSREVTTEAMRLARDIIKDQIRADGGKPSHYKASDVSKWAKELLEADASYYTQAEANLEARKTKPMAISLAGLKPDASLVEKDEKRKAAAKPKAGKQLSAKQAGMTAPPRSKPKAEAHTAH
jgi:hypothetical protein